MQQMIFIADLIAPAARKPDT